MSCNKSCNSEETKTTQYSTCGNTSGYIILIVLYILLAIILSSHIIF